MEGHFYGVDAKFVYYKDLKRTHPGEYWSLMIRKNLHEANYGAKMDEISLRLLSFAKAEARKEINLLKEYFGVNNLSLGKDDLFDDAFGKNLVEAINTALQLKEVYDRHMTRIAGKNGLGRGQAKITTAQLFTGYFGGQLYELAKEKFDDLARNGLIEKMTVEKIYEAIFSDKIIVRALKNAFFKSLKDSGDWDKNDQNKGYQRFFSEIENFKKHKFLKEIYQLYDLDKLRDKLKDTIKSKDNIEQLLSKNKTDATKFFQKSMKETTTQKGTLAEIMGNEMMLIIQRELSNGKNYTISSSKRIGASGNKPDIVATFGVDIQPFLDVVEHHYNDRTETVENFKKLNEHLRNLKTGFVVYTNVKDYTLSKRSNGYTFKGFSTGSDISLKSLEGVIANTPGGSQTLIGEIMSTMKGAIYEDQKQRLEKELCEKMAYFLFDDVTTIGVETAASAHAIHLLLLDGVYIPLSYLLYLMGTAVGSVGQSDKYKADDLFKVTITPGKIMYPKGGISPKNWVWEKEQWFEQKKEAYDKIKIGATFLKGFVQIVSEIHNKI